jgi:hypothetical protein
MLTSTTTSTNTEVHEFAPLDDKGHALVNLTSVRNLLPYLKVIRFSPETKSVTLDFRVSEDVEQECFEFLLTYLSSITTPEVILHIGHCYGPQVHQLVQSLPVNITNLDLSWGTMWTGTDELVKALLALTQLRVLHLPYMNYLSLWEIENTSSGGFELDSSEDDKEQVPEVKSGEYEGVENSKGEDIPLTDWDRVLGKLQELHLYHCSLYFPFVFILQGRDERLQKALSLLKYEHSNLRLYMPMQESTLQDGTRSKIVRKCISFVYNQKHAPPLRPCQMVSVDPARYNDYWDIHTEFKTGKNIKVAILDSG